MLIVKSYQKIIPFVYFLHELVQHTEMIDIHIVLHIKKCVMTSVCHTEPHHNKDDLG